MPFLGGESEENLGFLRGFELDFFGYAKTVQISLKIGDFDVKFL